MIASNATKARARLDRERARLAHKTVPGTPDLVVASEWRWAQRLLAEREAALRKLPGVVGLGLSEKIAGGVRTGEPCVVVFVKQKWKRKPARRRKGQIPRVLRSGKRVILTDVVELGPIELHSSVYPGQSIGPDVTPWGTKLRGTLGVYGRDAQSGNAVAITAMHVTGLNEYPAGPAPSTVPIYAPSLADPGPSIRFGTLLYGSRSGMDAAKIALQDPEIATSIIPGIGRVLGWRPTIYPGDIGASISMFGAVSGLQRGRIDTPAIYLPQYGLDSAILVNIYTQPGDSGCALIDSSRLLLGFLVGAAPNGLRVFCPASLVLSRLNCDAWQ